MLNREQEQASLSIGNIRILAGAGTGKTKTIIAKIENIINSGVKPEFILAITFTRQASNEMKERLEKKNIKNINVGTFHSYAIKMLRLYGESFGIKSNFSVAGDYEQEQIMKDVILKLKLDIKRYPPSKTLKIILRQKISSIGLFKFKDIVFQNIYMEYQKELKRNNALDFEDVLIIFNLLLDNKLFLEKLKLKYVLVDEFQDTNLIQNEILKKITKNVVDFTVVGDDSQSIYSFRGSQLENIINFGNNFQAVQTFYLKQNYRSTNSILNVSNALIKNNKNGLYKELITETKINDELVRGCIFETDTKEADFIVKEIKKLVKKGVSYSDIAIIYRAHRYSEKVKKKLRLNLIPFKAVGEISFWERAEIKNILAFFKILYNFEDNVSLKRLLKNVIPGIGLKTIEKIETLAEENSVSLYKLIEEFNINGITEKMQKQINKLLENLNKYNNLKDSITKMLDEIIIDYFPQLSTFNKDISLSDLSDKEFEMYEINENVYDFKIMVETFEQEISTEMNSFIEYIFEFNQDDLTSRKNNEVSLLTSHASKGLEFPVVFIIGIEEGHFPISRNAPIIEHELEEERRLFFVSITRAKDILYLCTCKKRKDKIPINTFSDNNVSANGYRITKPSRFLFELDKLSIVKYKI